MENEQKTISSPLSVTLSLEEYQRMKDELGSLQDQLATSTAALLSERQESDRLRWQLAMLERLHWGRSSEKCNLPEDSSRLKICFDEAPVEADVFQEKKKVDKEIKNQENYNRFRKSFKNGKSSHARKPIPAHISRVKTVLEPQMDLTGAIRMGEEVSEQYAIQPQMFFIEQLVRPRYKLPDGRIVIAELPAMPHPRSNASASVLAHIAVAKYADHLPLYRQIEIFAREGIRLPASTVSNWMMAAAQCIEPIYNELRETLKATRYVQADETPHKVLETEKPGSLHQGYMWAFYLPHCKSPYFEYHPGRNSSALGTLLSGQTQIVQSDGYASYDIFDKLPGKLHLCCWAHVRRKFIEARNYDPPAADYAIGEIAKLYALEKEIRENKPEDARVVALRQERSYPVIKALEVWATENLLKYPHDSPMEKAIRYMYSRFEQLSHYVNDAQLDIDNNAVERTIRPLTLNRKNCLFSGSHNAAHAAAIFFSLLGACKENNVNPRMWLEDCMSKVLTANPKDYSQLLPHNWKP